MDDYLRERLKKAGFPWREEHEASGPTLEVLIEACKPRTFTLELSAKESTWTAYASRPFGGDDVPYSLEEIVENTFVVEGKTAREAVALLWLEMNEKKS